MVWSYDQENGFASGLPSLAVFRVDYPFLTISTRFWDSDFTFYESKNIIYTKQQSNVRKFKSQNVKNKNFSDPLPRPNLPGKGWVTARG